jgi:hypothetical protein
MYLGTRTLGAFVLHVLYGRLKKVLSVFGGKHAVALSCSGHQISNAVSDH